MDALIQLLLTTEEIEFMNLDVTSKIELFTYISIPLCIALLYWGMQKDEDENEDENNKTRKR